MINPVPGRDHWPREAYIPIEPPLKKNMPGRPKGKRKKGAIELTAGGTKLSRKGRIMHCKSCKGEGHNSRTCPKKKSLQVLRPTSFLLILYINHTLTVFYHGFLYTDS
jgi:hypothetical protein